MAKNYREKEQEYERTGQFDRDLNDEHRTFDARDIGDGYNYLTKTFGERLRRFFLLPAVKVFGTIAAFFGLGFKVKGKKNARAVKGGAISVCNHAHELDTLLIKLALGCRRTYHTGSYYLLKKGWAGRIFKAGGFLPSVRRSKTCKICKARCRRSFPAARSSIFIPSTRFGADMKRCVPSRRALSAMR